MESNVKLLAQSSMISSSTPPAMSPKTTCLSSTPTDPGPSSQHIRFSTPPSSLLDSSLELSLSPDVSRRIRTRSESPPSALAILAAVCSSPSVHWDGRKHHYAEGNKNSMWYEDSRMNASQHTHIVEPSSPTSTLSYTGRPFTFRDGIKKEVEGYGDPEVQKLPTTMEMHYPVEDDDDDDVPVPQISRGLDYFSEFSPSSPTTLAVSSPLRDFSSSSERSITLPLSSPGPPFQQTPDVDTRCSSGVQDVDMGVGSRGILDASSPLYESLSDESSVHPGDVEVYFPGMKAEPVDALIPDVEGTEQNRHMSLDSAMHIPTTPPSQHSSLSPLLAPEPLPRSSVDFALSPLSSLVSSPLSEIVDEQPSSPAPSHFSQSGSAISARSVSPDPDFSDTDYPVKLKVGGRRASINVVGMKARRMSGFETAGSRHRSDTAPPEPTPRKRQRPSSPSARSARVFQARRLPSRSPSLSRSRRVITSSMALEENRRPGRNPKTRTKPKKSTTLASTSASALSLRANTSPEPLARPSGLGTSEKSTKRRKPNALNSGDIDGLPVETTDPDRLESSDTELAALPMTGFLVETLALSRASAMAAPELLRAVLKSQPHLMEEREEKQWLFLVRRVLERVPMFGRIERKGTDAADRPLESQWFYIPENDGEDGRAELLKGLMPNKRNVTKRSKQYYFEPVQKISRWDPEDD